jgi:ketosteroid isomerase-like protein
VLEHAAILFANDAFYTAFASRDTAAMADIWSARANISCIHPGWLPLIGREAVMESWQAILRNPDAPRIRCLGATAHPFGDAAFVACYEQLASGFLAATNIFVREGQIWRLVHHQAGVCPPPPAEDEAEPDLAIQ